MSMARSSMRIYYSMIVIVNLYKVQLILSLVGSTSKYSGIMMNYTKLWNEQVNLEFITSLRLNWKWVIGTPFKVTTLQMMNYYETLQVVQFHLINLGLGEICYP